MTQTMPDFEFEPLVVHKAIVLQFLRRHPGYYAVTMPSAGSADEAIRALEEHPGEWIVDGRLLTPEEYDAHQQATEGGAR